MKFIDLFSGLGGFHAGCKSIGLECVFASELDPNLRELYEINHGLHAHGDITLVDEKNIPEHDIICAGFPCQPFSLAGKKKGAKCPSSGKLIDHILRITKHHSPEFIFLENVPNILTIENGKFWGYIKNEFFKLGYTIVHKIISPSDLGIPQNRKRVFVVGFKNKEKLKNFKWPNNKTKSKLFDILDINLPHKKIEPAKHLQLVQWQKCLDNLDRKYITSKSLVAPEFGANYPFNFKSLSLEQMKSFRGSYGLTLEACTSWNEIYEMLPNYAIKNKSVPNWLEKSVIHSRAVYRENQMFLDGWKKNLDKSNNSWQILEWRAGSDIKQINDSIIQFRASGIRVSKPVNAPSLIAMTPTQTPIIPSQARYISEYEAAILQGLEKIQLPNDRRSAFKALGNAVNAKIVAMIARNFVNA